MIIILYICVQYFIVFKENFIYIILFVIYNNFDYGCKNEEVVIRYYIYFVDREIEF